MTRDLYTEVTARILADMEAGRMPWERPWDGSKRAVAGLPMNATTMRPYRGINVLLLWAAGLEFNPSDLRFLTFKQAKDVGGSVRKGERGHKVYFYKQLEVTDKETEETRAIPMLREYTVFHVTQTEGCKLRVPDGSERPAMPEDASEFVAMLGADVLHGGDRAMYMPGPDKIAMPFPQDFGSLDAYRAMLYHELTHWTGHDKRLARDLKNRLGSHDYAREELVAELGGAFLCAEFGLPYQTQHAAYLQNWLGTLREDKRAIFQAASKAQKAIDFIREQIAKEPAIAMAA